MKLNKINDYKWEIPKSGTMRVPGYIYSSETMIDKIIKEKAAEQVANVASLPGIVEKSLAMPFLKFNNGFKLLRCMIMVIIEVIN